MSTRGNRESAKASINNSNSKSSSVNHTTKNIKGAYKIKELTEGTLFIKENIKKNEKNIPTICKIVNIHGSVIEYKNGNPGRPVIRLQNNNENGYAISQNGSFYLKKVPKDIGYYKILFNHPINYLENHQSKSTKSKNIAVRRATGSSISLKPKNKKSSGRFENNTNNNTNNNIPY